MNNKGQSLVIFVVMIPIFLLLILLVYDIGNLIFEKQELDSVNQIVIDYGLDNYDDLNVVDEMYKLARYNNGDINIKIKYIDQEFYIDSRYYVKGIFTRIIKVDGYLARSTYKGYLDGDKHIIKRIK